MKTASKEPEYKVGDLVSLKSGGPQMVVEAILPYHKKIHPALGYLCIWFTGSDQVERAEFTEETLVLQERDH